MKTPLITMDCCIELA